jgi:transaldolase
MKNNPLLKLESLGQSVWLDDLTRRAIRSGELQQLIEEEGLSGVTSNPSTFSNALADSDDYTDDIRALASEGSRVHEIYEALAVRDIQMAAELFRPLYDRTDGRDGFVSLEVSPHLARDTHRTIAEARRFWKSVNRPNIFIKVPATTEGLPAIRQLIAEGINVNITLLFGLSRYRQVIEAYLAGLESLAGSRKSLSSVASVASFFLSRIDVLVDQRLEAIIDAAGSNSAIAANLRGQAAIACAKLAARIYDEIFSSDRFKALATRGARTQKLLWASTSTKNPAYPDLKYIEPLIGRHTINTMPLKTLQAYRDHGQPALRLGEGLAHSEAVLAHFADLGIDLQKIAQQLGEEGIAKFKQAYDQSMDRLQRARPALLSLP